MEIKAARGQCKCARVDALHPLLPSAWCIVPCIIVHRISHIAESLLMKGFGFFMRLLLSPNRFAASFFME